MNSSSPASPQEGAIKYRLDFRFGAKIAFEEIRELNAWRSILYRLGMIGRNRRRYGGLAYGNVSRRLGDKNTNSPAFLISGTQTGDLETLATDHYCIVQACRAEENWLKAEGPIKPSSEAMTHAALYAANTAIDVVIHAHCGEIWRNAYRLGIPVIEADIAYGTPDMAIAVGRLLRDERTAGPSIFAMLGHEDGIMAFGRSAESAALVLMQQLAAGLQTASDLCTGRQS